MANKKITRRALVMSVISLILCCAMLVGTTFAWFTDSVISGSNIIQSGNLDIELEYYDGTDDAGEAIWKTVNGESQLFSEEQWEPGHTQVVYLKLSNLGSLALKYQLGINIASETAGTNVMGDEFKLSNYIYMGVVEDVIPSTYDAREDAIAAAKAGANGLIGAGYTKSGVMENDQDKELYLAVVVYMPETVGNEANHNGKTTPAINLGLNVVATQHTAEEDSFGSNYDENAAFPNLVSTAADLDSMLNEGKNVTLEQDLKFNASETTANSGYKGNTGVSVKGGVLDGNGNTLTVTDANQTWGCAIHTTGGTIKNLTVSGAMRGIFTGGISKDLYIDNVTFKDVIYTFNSDGTKGSCANYGVYISNSTLNGWTSFSDMFKEVVITNCSFGEGSGYAFFRPYGSTEFINCNFAKGYEIDAVGVITFENCTLNGAPLTAENLATLVTSNTANASVK